MRGDSLRDLYAKTFAVMGLGLLAAAGALVDYWPVGGELPKVPSVAIVRPSLPGAAQLQQDIPAPSTARIVRASLRTQHSFAHSLRTVHFSDSGLAVADASAVVAPVPDAEIAFADCALELFAATGDLDLDLAPPIDLLAGNSQPDPSWSFTGAVKIARESLKDARSFLGTKLVGVVGAFRRVSPFWDTTGVMPLR